MNVTSTELKNKLKVILATDNSNPLVCLQLYVRIGSAWEKPEEAGFSHFTEHLVFKSTRRFPQNSIMDQVTNLGGSINAYTEYDTTCFYVTLPSGFLAEGLEMIAELAYQANFIQQDFDSEKMVVMEELKQYKNDPEDSFIEEIAEVYFSDNPFKNPIIGNPKRLNSSTPEDLRTFYRKYYVPNNCFLIISGDFDEEKAVSLTDKYFLEWQSTPLKITRKMKYDLIKTADFSFIKRNISNDLLAFALPDLSEKNPASYALSLAYKAFAIGKNSRLYMRLFDEEKLIDTIKVSSMSGICDGASFIVIMPKKNADPNRIISVVLQELRRFALYGMTHQELIDNKKEMIFFHRYSFEYVESLASSLGAEEILSGFEKFFDYPDLINKISLSDIGSVIKKYMQADFVHVFQKGKTSLDKDLVFQQLNVLNKTGKTDLSRLKFYEVKLPNGMQVILKKVKGKPTAGISLSYEVSQLNETAENLGINLLSSGLMLYGNEKRTYQQFLNYCTTNGISFGITPQAETTSLKLKCFTEMLPMGLELLADVVQTPTFPNEYFMNLKNTYISNIDREKDYPSYIASRLWKEMIFGKNSNVISRSGRKNSLRNTSLKQVKQWYADHFQTGNMSLAIVGDINFDIVLPTCEKLFDTDHNAVKTTKQTPLIQSSQDRFLRTVRQLDQSVICLGGFGCKSSQTAQNTAFHILAQIIGGETNSLLFNELREKRGLAYSVDFNFQSVRDFGYFDIVTIVDRKREEEALVAIMEVLDNVKKNGITEAELQKTKNYVRGVRLMEEESVLNQAQTLSVLEAIGFGYEYYKKRDERLEAVSVKQLRQLAEKYFNKKNYFIHILS